MNKETLRMQMLAGIITESQVNEEKYAEPMAMIQNIVDNWSDGGIDAEPAMMRIDKILMGNYEDESGDGYGELNENTMDVMAVLNRNGIDEDYFESMGGKEVESGTEEWLDVLSDITGKDAYNDEFTPEDDKLIQKFISDMEALGIELI